MVMADVEQRTNVRMRERRDGPPLTLEPLTCGRIGRQLGREHLDRDAAIEACVTRPVHLSHAACPSAAEDLVRAEPCAGGKRHPSRLRQREGGL